VRVDLDDRKIDLEPLDAPPARAAKPKSSRGPRKRKAKAKPKSKAPRQ
jgi:hypothetical protein